MLKQIIIGLKCGPLIIEGGSAQDPQHTPTTKNSKSGRGVVPRPLFCIMTMPLFHIEMRSSSSNVSSSK